LVTGSEGSGTATRSVLHRIAAHVLARRRYEVCGRFGLRATPGGFGTPAFGEGPEAVRVAGTFVLRETGGSDQSLAIPGATLRELARFAGTDIEAPFSAGDDTPALGDPDEPLRLDSDQTRRIADWFALGWMALDTVLCAVPPEAEPATIQLWPEHFDSGTNVGLPGGERVNLGFSPGDAFEAEPYAYVGPWSAERRGDPGFWNAPFGAVLRATDVAAAPAGLAECIEFLQNGIEYSSFRS
jgi:hypothetical protein